jgi:hypothetical protein
MFALPNMVYFFANKLSGLSGRSFTFLFVTARSL